jgi:hypothetical protein
LSSFSPLFSSFAAEHFTIALNSYRQAICGIEIGFKAASETAEMLYQELIGSCIAAKKCHQANQDRNQIGLSSR